MRSPPASRCYEESWRGRARSLVGATAPDRVGRRALVFRAAKPRQPLESHEPDVVRSCPVERQVGEDRTDDAGVLDPMARTRRRHYDVVVRGMMVDDEL